MEWPKASRNEWPTSREALAARQASLLKEPFDGHQSMGRMVARCLEMASSVLWSWRELRDIESV